MLYLFRLLGIFALFNHRAGKLNVHGPFNMIVMLFSGFAVYMTIYTQFWLNSVIAFWVIVLLFGSISLLMLTCMLCKNVIFQREYIRLRPLVPTDATTWNLRFTGMMHATAPAKPGPGRGPFRFAQRVLEQNARLEFGPRPRIYAFEVQGQLIDMMHGVISRTGWVSNVEAGTLAIEQIGFQYLGMERRPAMRITYVEQIDDKRLRRTAVMSFDTEEERDALQAYVAQAAS